MELQHIRIQGFKSIEDVTFEPKTGFSCLVGSNGSGKSNFCDALIFFKNVVVKGVSSAIQEIGEKNLLTDSQEISFSLKANHPGSSNVYDYYLSINIQEKKIIAENLSTEIFSIYSRKQDAADKLDLEKLQNFLNDILVQLEGYKEESKKDKKSKNKKFEDIMKTLEKNKKQSFRDNIQDELNSDKTALSFYYENESIYKYIENLNVFRINPLVPKLPNKIFNDSNLLMYGENLATILLALQKDKNKWATLHELLSLIVPSVDEVSLQKGDFDDQLMLNFKENGKVFPAISISDGTIYTLAILTAILWNQDKDSLIIIEEPERGIHPQAIVEIISFIKEAVLEKKLSIIITTHSETVVRSCTLDELWIVDKIKGCTKLKNAKESNPHLKEASLDQAWLMNLLNGGLPW
ncbi:MAG TPA: ATP-binding protein [Erysipelothrix sp.]